VGPRIVDLMFGIVIRLSGGNDLPLSLSATANTNSVVMSGYIAASRHRSHLSGQLIGRSRVAYTVNRRRESHCSSSLPLAQSTNGSHAQIFRCFTCITLLS
jgi:hypothetical protein